MKKPKPIEDNIYDIHEIVHYIQQKYKINPYDFHNSFSHFDLWCDAQGYVGKDAQGKSRKESQIWFKAYQSHAQGETLRPPYEDFWKYFMNWYSPQTNEIIDFNVKGHLNHNNSRMMTKMLDWIQIEFGDEVTCMLTDY